MLQDGQTVRWTVVEVNDSYFLTMNGQRSTSPPWLVAIVALLLGFRAVVGCEATHAAASFATEQANHCKEMAAVDSVSNAGRDTSRPDDELAKQHNCISACHAMALLQSNPLATLDLPRPQLAAIVLTSLDGSKSAPATPPPRTA